MIYLRIIEFIEMFGSRTKIDIFKGNVEKNKKFWKINHNAKARYFELKEVKK